MNFEFDEIMAKDLIGEVILVGITYLNSDGELESQRQFSGSVLSASLEGGIKLKLGGQNDGSDYNLPPDTSCIWAADSGVYTLSERQETLKDPDYLCTWEVHQNDKQ